MRKRRRRRKTIKVRRRRRKGRKTIEMRRRRKTLEGGKIINYGGGINSIEEGKQ